MVPKVIIDTDAGIDDAFALFIALEAHRNKEIEICAITTVNGNTSLSNVNVNVLRVLNTASQLKIPVYSGASSGLVSSFVFPERPFHGKDGFGDTAHESLPPSTSLIKEEFGALAMIRLISDSPGEIILVALGPLTNIAIALNIKPDITQKLKDFYIMGGNVSRDGNITLMGEFNFTCDPEAAKVVLERSIMPIKVVPWETCIYEVQISYDERIALADANTPSAKLMNLIERNIIRREDFTYYITCDQLAVAWMLDEWTKLSNPDRPLVTEKKFFFATVELSGNHSRGLTVIDYRNKSKKSPNIIVMKKLCKETYMKYLKMAFQ